MPVRIPTNRAAGTAVQIASRARKPCAETCPVSRAAAIIEGKWTTRIIRDLLGGKKRYSELLGSLTGISPKVLAARLRFLERQGVLAKTTYPVMPPRTEYELTPCGKRLRPVVLAMAKFGLQLER